MLLDGRVVLVRHRAGSRTYHLLPGGGVAWGETLEAALVREFAEETGLRCRVGRPILLSETIAPDRTRHVVNITFACQAVGGAVTPTPADSRVEAVDLVAPEQLADLDLRPALADRIAPYLADENLPAAYVTAPYVPD